MLNFICIIINIVVVCTDLRQGAAHTGGRGYSGDIREPTWCNGSTLAWNARDVSSSPALGTIFPIFITPAAILLFVVVVICACFVLTVGICIRRTAVDLPGPLCMLLWQFARKIQIC